MEYYIVYSPVLTSLFINSPPITSYKLYSSTKHFQPIPLHSQTQTLPWNAPALCRKKGCIVARISISIYISWWYGLQKFKLQYIVPRWKYIGCDGREGWVSGGRKEELWEIWDSPIKVTLTKVFTNCLIYRKEFELVFGLSRILR